MTSRERVLAALAHEEPDRVPCWCGSSAEFWAKAKRELSIADDEVLRLRFGDDFRRVYARYAGPPVPLSPGATSRTPSHRARANPRSVISVSALTDAEKAIFKRDSSMPSCACGTRQEF